MNSNSEDEDRFVNTSIEQSLSRFAGTVKIRHGDNVSESKIQASYNPRERDRDPNDGGMGETNDLDYKNRHLLLEQKRYNKFSEKKMNGALAYRRKNQVNEIELDDNYDPTGPDKDEYPCEDEQKQMTMSSVPPVDSKILPNTKVSPV